MAEQCHIFDLFDAAPTSTDVPAAATPTVDWNGLPEPVAGMCDYARANLMRARDAVRLAQDAGLNPFTYTHFLAEVNAGQKQGWSIAALEYRHSILTTMQDGLNTGSVRPREVVGKGGTKTEARAYLATSLKNVAFDLAHQGALNSTNLANYHYHLSALLRLNGITPPTTAPHA